MRTALFFVVSVLGLSACNPVSSEGVSGDDAALSPSKAGRSQPLAAVAVSETQAPEAEFTRASPSHAVMELTRQGDGQWRVAFSAGGVPNGAATAADCELQAVGPQDHYDVISAKPTPFTSDQGGLTSADIGAEPPAIQVRVGPEGAFVSDTGAAARYCAIGSDIDGFYKRVETPD